MHIVIYAHYQPPKPSASSTRMLSLARYLRDKGHEVTLLTSAPGPDNVEGIPIVRPAGRKGLLSWIARQPKGVLFASSPPATPAAEVALLARALGWKVMVDVRDPYVIEAKKIGELKPGLGTSIKTFLEWSLPRAAHRMSFVSEFLRTEFRKFTGHPIEDSVIAPNGADLGTFFYSERRREAARQQLGMGDEVLFCYQGILGGKDLDKAILAILPCLKRGAKLLIMGIVDEHSAPLKTELFRLMAQQGVKEQLLWKENLSVAQLAETLCAVDFGINPLPLHRAYCLPVKTYEYLASGVFNLAHGGADSALSSLLSAEEGYCMQSWEEFGSAAEVCMRHVTEHRSQAGRRAELAQRYGREASNVTLAAALESLGAGK